MRQVDVAVWRFAAGGLAVAVVFLAVLLALWVAYLLGPEMSRYDIGSPQIRVFV